MKNKYITTFSNLAHGIPYGITSGVLVSLSFPSFGLFYFAFFGFVPLFIALEKYNTINKIVAVIAFVLTLYAYMLSWLKVFHPLALPTTLIYLCFVHIIPIAIYSFCKKNTRDHGVYNGILLALLFCSMEFLRGVGFTRFPYGNIAYTQFEFLSFIQIAEITGYLGISFFIYLLNAYIAQLITHFYFFINKWNMFNKTPPNFLKIATSRFSVMFMVFIFLLAYGFTRISYFDEISVIETNTNIVNTPTEDAQVTEKQITTYTRQYYDPLTVRLVQPWFDYNQKWTSENKEKLFEKLTRLSSENDPTNPLRETDLIIWPESAILDYYEYKLENYANSYSHKFKNFFEEFSKNYQVRFLIGSLSMSEEKTTDFLTETNNEAAALSNSNLSNSNETNSQVASAKDAKTGNIKRELKKYNASLYLTPTGEVRATSGKIYLVPFAEYFPFDGLLEKMPWLKEILKEAQASSFSPFPQKKVFFDQDIVPFSSMICYEDCFDTLASTYTLSGAKFLVVITNDAWSYSEKSQELHYMFSVLRAIENRRPILRVANAGITGLINANGKLQYALPQFEEGRTTFKFRPLSYQAFYTDLGITLVSFFILVFIVIYIPYLLLKNTVSVFILSKIPWLKQVSFYKKNK